jgi:hypothetical protein
MLRIESAFAGRQAELNLVGDSRMGWAGPTGKRLWYSVGSMPTVSECIYWKPPAE